jgi:hypothetical protein
LESRAEDINAAAAFNRIRLLRIFFDISEALSRNKAIAPTTKASITYSKPLKVHINLLTKRMARPERSVIWVNLRAKFMIWTF